MHVYICKMPSTSKDKYWKNPYHSSLIILMNQKLLDFQQRYYNFCAIFILHKPMAKSILLFCLHKTLKYLIIETQFA